MSLKKKIAILIDLERNEKSGGHVKFWEKISQSLVKKKTKLRFSFFFFGKRKENN